jgi:hypothetical protein
VVSSRGRLEFDAVLLGIVTLVGPAAVVALIRLRRGGVGRRGLAVVVAVVGLCRVSVVSWSSGPAGAVEGLTTGFATATGCYAALRKVRMGRLAGW